MTVFIALLRGINVGKAKRIPMADLRVLLEGLGHESVATLLNSGNAVFRAAHGTPIAHAAAISAAISAQFQFDVPVVVKSARELAAIVAGNTLAADAKDLSRLLAVFMQDAKDLRDLAVIEPLLVPPEQLLIGKQAAYLHCASGILASKAGEALLKKAGKATTTRNWATVLKLQALVDDAEG